MVKLTKDKINEFELTELLRNDEAGSIVVFLGEPRKGSLDGNVSSIEYTAYEEMAVQELKKIEEEAKKREGILNVIIVHRLGDIPLKETSLFVGVSSRHREEGFETAKWIIEEVKKVVPIWKEIKYEGNRNS
ncbi:molybdenum cofactor biosynthesis protein MoaE [Caldisericum exile]|uniref:Molybdopterin synthase catalytic subunit n=1 Tax=Caldisericum exile (strain DSM 21853 / NBRC 104410 / AZM16c01) TaxID=511051 RepID=A0A7U6GDM0_CALEA|nr:molybdenum cofactor biosynthesis protein MoaE [Caldisericum exile]BAL80475.1 molybdopterin synthase large subunit MoaE [Caldisericum exile AZM16c01]